MKRVEEVVETEVDDSARYKVQFIFSHCTWIGSPVCQWLTD